jgi:hypothetical protein
MTGSLALRSHTLTVNYEPWRLVSAGKRIVENELAPVDMKIAEAKQAQKGKNKRCAAQLAAEADLHQRWRSGNAIPAT